MLLEEYIKQKFKENNININLYIKMQNLELIKYMSKKEKFDCITRPSNDLYRKNFD